MILVIAEERQGTIIGPTWEALAAAQAIAGDEPVQVVVPGGAIRAQAESLAVAAVAEVRVLEHPQLDQYTSEGWVTVLAAAVRELNPRVVVLPHTYRTRDFAPRLAARLRRPFIADVIGVHGTGSGATFLRPMFQGKLVADVRARGEGPVFVSVQIGAFRADAVRRGGGAPVTSVPAALDPDAIRQQPETPFQEARQAVDLGQAERIVSVGRGIKSQEQLPVAERLASALGAELAASRPICDSGWIPMERQVGSSGQTVAPKLYVALGISGAIQHLVGMKGSRTIVAINKDPEAPIFEVADYGIVGDLFEIVPAITTELEKR